MKATSYDPGRDCSNAKGSCVVAALERELSILKDATQPRDARDLALRFVVHFVGDIHQPLHCADDHDTGGNDKG